MPVPGARGGCRVAGPRRGPAIRLFHLLIVCTLAAGAVRLDASTGPGVVMPQSLTLSTAGLSGSSTQTVYVAMLPVNFTISVNLPIPGDLGATGATVSVR